MSDPRLTALTVSLAGGPQVRRLQASLARFASSITHVVWQQPDPCIGLIHGINEAMKLVRTPYVMILHEDMKMDSAPDDFVDRLLSRFDHPMIGMVAPRLNEGAPQQMTHYPADWSVPNVSHEGMTMRTDLYRSLGGLDEMFDIPTEDGLFTSMYDDAEFGLRASSKGYRSFVAHDLELWHEGRCMSSRLGEGEHKQIEAICLLRFYLKWGAPALQQHFGWKTDWIKEACVAEGAVAHHQIVMPELAHV